MTTIYEVAEKAGVSPSTVSRALRGNPRISQTTIDRVERVAADLHYVPKFAAQVLAGSTLRTLGMVLPTVAGSYYGELALGFETRASELDCSVVIFQSNHRRNQAREIRNLVGQVDAVAFLAKSMADDLTIRQVKESRPVVTVARTRLPGVPAIFAESTAPAKQLTQHLIGNGRRRLAFVGPIDEGSDIAARHNGFVRATQAAGLRVPPNIDVRMEEPAGRLLARDLIAKGLPYDGLVCGSDEIAIALIDEFLRNGVSIPEQVAIVGWDDIQAARYLRPELTTVRQPVAQLGALAVELLHRLLGDEAVPMHTTLPTTIMHRRSCGCVASVHSLEN